MNGRDVVASRVEGKHLTVQFEFSRKARPDTTLQSEANPYFDQLVSTAPFVATVLDTKTQAQAAVVQYITP